MLIYDDPDTVPVGRLRSDACVELRAEISRSTDKKRCPECGKVLKSGWTGIDGHWRSRRYGHEDIMSYEEARSLLLAGIYAFPVNSLPPGILLDTLVAGRYAVYAYHPYGDLPKAVRHLFKVWLPQSAEEMDNRACMRINRSSPSDIAPESLPIDICMPLKPLY